MQSLLRAFLWALLAWICIGLAVAAGNARAAEIQAQDLARIATAAELAVREDAAARGGHIDARAAAIDERLRFQACEGPLRAKLMQGETGPRVTVQVSCPAPVAWKLFVPVLRSVQRQVVVARATLTRGKVLTPDDVILAERETSTLGSGYLTDTRAVIGQTLRRGVNEGSVLIPQALAAPAMVRPGQEVSLEAGAADFRVRVPGIARTEGGLGEIVRVENISSKRIVQAIVRSEKTVEVLLP